jgi:hypothetical protein
MQTATTTTTFRIVLMLDAMGMYLLIRYRATPTTINAITRFIKGIFSTPQQQATAIRVPIVRQREKPPLKSGHTFA